MELRLALLLVLWCVTLNTGWCMDQDTQSLVDRLERSTVTNFTTADWYVWHMEIDLFIRKNVIYTDLRTLKTSDGTSSTIVAGSGVGGYKEGNGSEAMFNYIYGFTQITDNRVVVADRDNHCLRVIVRQTGLTSVFSGQCGSKGESEGQPGLFDKPQYVIRDTNNDGQLLVIELNRNVVRTVDISDGRVGTFVKSDILSSIHQLTQDDNGNLYVTSGYYALYSITYREKRITLISGSPSNLGYIDSSLLNSRFYRPEDLMFIGNQTLLISDRSNNKIRLIDINADRVTTLDLCSGCLYWASSLLLTNHYLYVGQYLRIQQFKLPCPEKNVTLYVRSDDERAIVEITPDVKTRFAVGSHVIDKDNCSINVMVINNGTASQPEKCPEVIRGVVSASTGLSALDLSLDGTIHTLELPMGVYNYRISGKSTNCSLKVEIKDYLLVREVDIFARYGNVKCTVLTDKVALSTLTSVANGNVNQIKEICQHYCNPKAGSQAKLSCDNDTLTVTWSTDVTFDGTVTEIPEWLMEKLTDRLIERSRYPTLDVVVISRMPPLVYPTKLKNGAYAELVLTSSCLHNKSYDKETDSCV